MNVNMNLMTKATSKKQDIPKQSNKSEEFKKILDNRELNSRNYSGGNIQKKYNKDQNLDKAKTENQGLNVEKKYAETKDIESKGTDKYTEEGDISKELNNSDDNKDLKVTNLIEEALAKLKQTAEGSSKELEGPDKSGSQMEQLQQLLQLFSSMLKNVSEASVSTKVDSELKSINLETLLGVEQLIGGEKLTPDVKSMLKNNLSEIVALLEKSKGNNNLTSETVDVIQKLTTKILEVKGDLNLLKTSTSQTVGVNSDDVLIKENLLKKVIEQSTKTASEIVPENQMQSSSDAKKDNKSSGNSSFEEKFLNNLLGEDKDQSKISKAVNFMNQFEAVKTVDAPKVQMPNIVIDKNNVTVDVIKSIKFMEINNIKDLTVKMNPKELGEITIKLTMESGIMKASISALNKDTYNLLNQNIQDISDKLKNMDIKIQSLDINIYEDSTFFNKNSNEKNNNGSENNNRNQNMGLEDEGDISISNNYAIEENQVNKFV
ncbi:flagellar hook-length control protein FliK [Clostridium sp. CF012]|uniref:flagellar hook-length control protein FliK n=1 Tax=Clostridium sp. CF012 TaxID=2843319 RepID=UPI001C0B1ECB|nr:flagellar hook-length control protein FliK [Clostridium sp. CF012]MBU3142306.1 flagellar hook-length control protein FliK [Clostridium sp. CF012]